MNKNENINNLFLGSLLFFCGPRSKKDSYKMIYDKGENEGPRSEKKRKVLGVLQTQASTIAHIDGGKIGHPSARAKVLRIWNYSNLQSLVVRCNT